MTDEDREDPRPVPPVDPDLGVPITSDDPKTPLYNELTGEFRAPPDPAAAQHIADEESIEEADWPTDGEEAANPPPEPDSRVTPDAPA